MYQYTYNRKEYEFSNILNRFIPVQIRACFLLIFFLSSSCRKFVEVAPPKGQMVNANVFNSDETAISALLGLYVTMGGPSLPYNVSLFTGTSGDELTTYSNLSTHLQMYQNAMQPLDAATNEIWNLGYNIIYQSNAILEGCKRSSGLSQKVKEQLIGEALFVRAFWHFYLLNLFGDIPIITTTNYDENKAIHRSDSLLVYEQIISDLKDAEEMLGEDYVAQNSVSKSTDRIRPNKFTVNALLARVYLYTKDYLDASIQSTNIIEKTNLYDTSSVQSCFLAASREAIWQLAMPMPSNNNHNTWEGAYFTLTSRPMTNAFNCSAVSNHLLNAFEAGDHRRLYWIGSYTDETVIPNVTYCFPYKYKIQNSSSIVERSIVFRLAEQYLIRAESRAWLNDFEGAISDINIIRKRSGLDVISLDNINSKDDLLNIIFHERQVELFSEWGHRWLDIKRTGRINAIMTNVAPVKNSVWNIDKSLWPIPQSEIARNVNLEQNNGYN